MNASCKTISEKETTWTDLYWKGTRSSYTATPANPNHKDKKFSLCQTVSQWVKIILIEHSYSMASKFTKYLGDNLNCKTSNMHKVKNKNSTWERVPIHFGVLTSNDALLDHTRNLHFSPTFITTFKILLAYWIIIPSQNVFHGWTYLK